jgi:acyl-coenzyme A thioesterase PaaI-like protein
MKWILTLYPPYLGAGIKVDYIADDWRELKVSMPLRFYNRNYVGTHFGGSLYSLVDPHVMLLLMNILGKGYWVWDKSADIDFVKPGKTRVSSHIQITDTDLNLIREKTVNGDKYFAKFIVEVKDINDELVARVNKTIYVRKKKPK